MIPLKIKKFMIKKNNIKIMSKIIKMMMKKKVIVMMQIILIIKIKMK